MADKGTPAIVVKGKGKTSFYCGKKAAENKAKKEGKAPIKEGAK